MAGEKPQEKHLSQKLQVQLHQVEPRELCQVLDDPELFWPVQSTSQAFSKHPQARRRVRALTTDDVCVFS